MRRGSRWGGGTRNSSSRHVASLAREVGSHPIARAYPLVDFSHASTLSRRRLTRSGCFAERSVDSVGSARRSKSWNLFLDSSRQVRSFQLPSRMARSGRELLGPGRSGGRSHIRGLVRCWSARAERVSL